ncbi:MAG: hypothetical protein HQK53_01475 [Oligoflexia bacterium]|nr:hypothetical protein [Oligoflexia bacterium]
MIANHNHHDDGDHHNNEKDQRACSPTGSPTSVTGDEDCHPLEGLFFYWKTSPTLWESKLKIFASNIPLFIPINWGYHFVSDGDKENNYDFGDIYPEKDLKRLIITATKLGLRPILLIPLTPTPFIINGGIPASLAQNLSIAPQGIAYGIVTAQGKIHKIFSYFSPKVYRNFGKFTWELGKYLSNNSISIDIIGMISGYCINRQFHSFLSDTSNAFEQGFLGLMELKESEKKNNSPYTSTTSTPSTNSGDFHKKFAIDHNNTYNDIYSDEDETSSGIIPSIPTVVMEIEEKNEFHNMIQGLYLDIAKQSFGENWGGEIKFSFLGGGIYEIFDRYDQRQEHPSRYFRQIIESMVLDIIPSSVLLPLNVKSGLFTKIMRDLINQTSINKKIENLSLYENDYISFSNLNFFEIFCELGPFSNRDNHWESLGLILFLEKNYAQTYLLQQSPKDIPIENVVGNRVIFCCGEELTEVELNRILRAFMNGGKILIDSSKLPLLLTRKLETFFLENSIYIQKINYITEVLNASLGEGRLLLFNGEKILHQSLIKKNSFWENLINYFEISHLPIATDSNVHFLWKIRRPYSHEMNFEEIRRVTLYNPTSYKKYVSVPVDKKFTFLKIIDGINTNGRWEETELLLELLPDASASLDFGYNE